MSKLRPKEDHAVPCDRKILENSPFLWCFLCLYGAAQTFDTY